MMPRILHALFVSALLAMVLQGCVYSRGTFDLFEDNPDDNSATEETNKNEIVDTEGENIPIEPADRGNGLADAPRGTTGRDDGGTGVTTPVTAGGTTSGGPPAGTGTTGTEGSATAGTPTGSDGATGGGIAVTPPPESASGRAPACYQFAYVSNKDGADNIYFGSNCRAFGEWKLTVNTDPNLKLRNVSLQADLGLVAADTERVNGSSRVFLGSQVWDLRNAGAATAGAFRTDINNDGSPDFETPFSASWGEGRLMAFAAWAPDRSRQVVRLQLAADNPDTTYYPLTIPNASGGMSFDKVWWFPKKYPAAGHDLLLLSARKSPTSPYRLYTRDLYQRSSDDIREILSGDEPAKSQLNPSLSSDGSKVVFVKSGASGEKTIWVSRLSVLESPDRRDPATPLRLSGTTPRMLASGDSPCLTHDGATVLFEKSGEIWMIGESGETPAVSLGISLSHQSLACSPKPAMLRAYTSPPEAILPPQEPVRVYQYPREETFLPYSGTGGTSH